MCPDLEIFCPLDKNVCESHTFEKKEGIVFFLRGVGGE